jgi:hypothetical protein
MELAMCIADRTVELDSIALALLKLTGERSQARTRLAHARVVLAQAEREAADADAAVTRAEQQQRVLLAQSEVLL